MSEANRQSPVSDTPTKRAFAALLVALTVVVGLFAFVGPGFYLWAKAFHVIAIIAWMAALLYLHRLFIYHCEAEPGSTQSETFKVMERRLLKAIMTPAMLVAWILGLWLAWQGNLFSETWFHVKLAGVVLLSATHGLMAGSVRRFAADRNTRSQRFWRLVNEVPTVLMIVIVIMVIVKPL